jgi:hypothetical protein
VKVDSDLEVIGIAVPASTFLYGGDLPVQALGHGVGDAMLNRLDRSTVYDDRFIQIFLYVTKYFCT